jgi:hypothetical protein
VSYPRYPEPGSHESPWAHPSESAYGWPPPAQPRPPTYSAPPFSPEPSYPPEQAYPQQQGYEYGPHPYLVDSQAYPPYPYRPAEHSSIGLKIFVVGLSIALIAALGAVTYLLFGAKDAGPTKLTIASATTTPISTPTYRSGLDHFTLPSTVDGLPPSTSQAMSDLTKYMTDSMLEKDGAPAVARVYQSRGNASDLFVLAGISTVMVDPSAQLSDLFTGLRAQSRFSLGKPASYGVGALGGSLKCVSGRLSANGLTAPVGICMLADPGGMIVAMYFHHSPATTAKVVKEIRPKFER